MADTEALSPEQQEALAAFLAAHERAEQACVDGDVARDDRARALVVARDLNVPVRVLAETSGLHRSRVFQIRNEGRALLDG